MISNIDIKIGSNRNIKKVKVYHQKSTQSQSPATTPEASIGVLSLKSSYKSIKGSVTILPVGNKKKQQQKNKQTNKQTNKTATTTTKKQ